VRGWLGSAPWRSARFRSRAALARLAADAGLAVESTRGAVYYPPWGGAARLLAPLDPWLGARTSFGAAFVAVAARKPRTANRSTEEGPGSTIGRAHGLDPVVGSRRGVLMKENAHES
jgi:hypothetical protein